TLTADTVDLVQVARGCGIAKAAWAADEADFEARVGKALDGVVDDWRLNWVWMPPWGPERITDDGKDQMRALGFNI
ncbi:MAG: hypothetical protein ACLGIS_19435, partial [Actinomycetes bacterium]